MRIETNPRSFAGKFLEKIDKISQEEIEAFLARLQSEKNFFESVLDHLLEGAVVTDPTDGSFMLIEPQKRY